MVHSSCVQERNVSVDVVAAEIIAIHWGLMLAKDLKLEKIVVQSDAKAVVDIVNLNQYNALLEPIIDIRFLLSSFNFLSLSFLKRACNMDAHNLARLACFVGSRTWIGGSPNMESPSFVSDPVSSSRMKLCSHQKKL